MIRRSSDMLLLQIGLIARDIGEADRVAPYLRLRFFGLELEVRAARQRGAL